MAEDDYKWFRDLKYSSESKERVMSGIEELDRMVNGFEKNSVTIFTGKTNAGKTTLLSMLIGNFVKQGKRVFWFNGENTMEKTQNNFFIQNAPVSDIYQKQYKDTVAFDSFVKDETATKLQKQFGNMICVYNNNKSRDILTLLKVMNDAYVKDKVRVFVLDNFMQIDNKYSDLFRGQSVIMEAIRTFAVTHNVVICLVVHPKKGVDTFERLTTDDVFGSSDITNKAYNVISITRLDTIRDSSNVKKMLLNEGYLMDECDAMLEVLKQKGNRNGVVGLKYNKKLKTYTQARQITQEEKIKLEEEEKNSEKKPWK